MKLKERFYNFNLFYLILSSLVVILLLLISALFPIILELTINHKELADIMDYHTKTKFISSQNRHVELPSVPEYGPDLFCYYVDDICSNYPNVDPAIVKAIIWKESRFNPNCKSDGGYSIGLMQVSTKWHMDRAYSLGVEDLYDPYGNILVGVDYLNDLLEYNKDLGLSLMLYNMNHNDAYRLYKSGRLSSYATSVMEKSEEYRNGGV